MLTCPICFGPLHFEDPDNVACERGHGQSTEEAITRINDRLQASLWMALNALDTEASMWAALAESNGSTDAAEHRDRAESEAALLRDVLHRTEPAR